MVLLYLLLSLLRDGVAYLGKIIACKPNDEGDTSENGSDDCDSDEGDAGDYPQLYNPGPPFANF